MFNELINNRKQIVITSDRPANELDLMSRLKSRFSWGLPVDIKKPNLELRKAILKKKLQFLIERPEMVEDEALSYIAESFTESIRELEGALRKFVYTCVAFNQEFSLENAKSSLDSLKQDELKEKLTKKQIVCFCFSTLGLVLITGVGGGGTNDMIGILFGLGAALLYATVVLINKFIKFFL